MKPKILVVEDDKQILSAIKTILEMNDFEPIVAENGQLALNIISRLDFLPDIILSDIMMPEMDGYAFYKKVSEEPRFHLIPFIFISAKASPEDIRFGKMLGADDYLTKPFLEEDLLAIISGKLSKSQNIRKMSDEISKKLLKNLNIDIGPSLLENECNSVFLLFTCWDGKLGPVLKTSFPSTEKVSIPLQDIAFQLFQASVSVYGHYHMTTEAEGVLLRITNINMDGYILFDFINEKDMLGGKSRFMLAALAPKINYLESIRIKEIFLDISKKVKAEETWLEKDYWEEIVEILTSPLLSFD